MRKIPSSELDIKESIKELQRLSKNGVAPRIRDLPIELKRIIYHCFNKRYKLFALAAGLKLSRTGGKQKGNMNFESKIDKARDWTADNWNTLIWYIDKGVEVSQIARDINRHQKDIREKIKIIEEARARRGAV